MRRQILFSSVAPQDAEPEIILKKIMLYSLYMEGAVIVDKINTKKVNIFFVKIKFVIKLSIIMCCASTAVHCLTTNGFKYALERFMEVKSNVH